MVLHVDDVSSSQICVQILHVMSSARNEMHHFMIQLLGEISEKRFSMILAGKSVL